MYSKQTVDLSYETLAIRSKANESTNTMADHKIYQKQKKKAKRQHHSNLYHKEYQAAIYSQAVQFRNSMSYKKKVSENNYKQIQVFQDTNELKVFGLGPYLFIEFQRRIVWLFLVFAILEALCIYINVMGTGLTDYPISFGTYLVISTLGNFNRNAVSPADAFIMVIIPCVIYLIFFLFFLFWKCHYDAVIKQEDQDQNFIKPEKFCVEIEGFQQGDLVQQDELEEMFSSFGPIYEVSLCRDYDGNLKYFEELDQLQEEIKQEENQLKLCPGQDKYVRELIAKKQKVVAKINTLKIQVTIRSAYIHFQFQKSKVDMLQYFSDHYLFSQKFSHTLMRNLCCCCVNQPSPKYQYKGKNLYIKHQKVPQPEDINWDYYEVGALGKIFRVLFSFLIIVVFLAISCTIIGLCSIYISSQSVNCEGVVIPTDFASVGTITTEQQKKCFCRSNFIASFSNQGIKTYCGEILNQVYAEQGIQYAITFTSTFVNIIFGLVVSKLVSFTQPLSFSTSFLWRTSINTIFLIFNTVFLPLLLCADIFGFKANNYVSFVTLISSDVRNFFNVESIRLYFDFEKIWYRNVSPIFVNYIVIDFALTWVFFILYKCMCAKQHLQSKQGLMLQKKMNLEIISWKLNIADEFAYFNLIIFMAIFYCCGIPVLIPLAFVNLFSKYITNRSLLQSLSSRVSGLSEAFNGLPLTIIPIMLAIACLLGSWMLTANDMVIQITDTVQITIAGLDWYLLVRELQLPFYIILAAIIALYFFLSNVIIRFFKWIEQSCHDRKNVVHPYHVKEYSHYAKTMSIMPSYDIRNNLKFKNVIFNLDKYLYSQEK